jgi:hypothetical protein
MTNNELKNSFLSYYNNDITKYQSQIVYNTNPTIYLGVNSGISAERVFHWASVEKQNSNSTKLVHLIYFDESHDSYHNATNGDNTKTSLYTTDIALLRASLDNQTNYGDKMVIIFCIERNDTTGYPDSWKIYNNFSHFIDNVSTGANGFDGANGLADRSEVIFIRNVKPQQDSAYYHQKTIDALKDLGYNIT